MNKLALGKWQGLCTLMNIILLAGSKEDGWGRIFLSKDERQAPDPKFNYCRFFSIVKDVTHSRKADERDR